MNKVAVRDSIIFFKNHLFANSELKYTYGLILLISGALRPVQAAEQSAEVDEAIQPSVGIRFAFDSNTYDTSIDEIESWISVVTPTILLSSAPAQQRYTLLYQGEYGFFSEDSDDNYADHLLAGVAQFELSSRAHLELGAAAEKQHRDRGSDQTDGINPTSESFPSEPDKFDRIKWGGKLRYGADGNRGRLRFGVGGTDRDYSNNLERTRFFNYTTRSGSAGISLNLHQRTAVEFDAVLTDTIYKSTPPGEASRDSEDWRYLLGLSWEATAKTTGSIRAGIQRRRFDNSARVTTSNPSWEIDVRWSPREYSHFDFVTSRRNEETFAEGAFIDTRSYKVAWSHQWKRNWDTIVSLARIETEFVESTRSQDFNEFYLGLSHPQGRLLVWQAGYARRSRNSGFDSLVYDGDMYTLGVTIGN